jgi:type I restriction enzyme S subunit
MSFPQYPSYKDSGVEWLGEVPEHWGVKRLKFAVSNAGIKIGPFGGMLTDLVYGDEGDFKVYGQENVLSGDFEKGTRWIPKERWEALPGYVPKAGDLLFTRKGSIGGCCPFPEGARAGIIDSDTIRVSLDSNALEREFLLMAFKFAYYQEAQVEMVKRGAILSGLNSEVLANLVIVAPPIDEQRRIAEFLVREVGKLDGLVAEQRRLMELLKEKRQAVISHAVTRGLNPDVPLKHSGIEWLGDVPEHWTVVALKHLVSRPIIDGPHETPIKRDEGIPFVSAEAVSQGSINFDKIWGYISPEDHAEYSKRYRPKRGDILLVKLGATTGTPAIVETDEDFNIWVPLPAIRPKAEIEPRFILHVLRSDNLKIAYELNWTYGTQQTLGLRTISNLLIPIPPKEEREAIVKHLDSKLPLFELLTTEAQRAIDLLQERRTALISAAVTGQIDVRGIGTA